MFLYPVLIPAFLHVGDRLCVRCHTGRHGGDVLAGLASLALAERCAEGRALLAVVVFGAGAARLVQLVGVLRSLDGLLLRYCLSPRRVRPKHLARVLLGHEQVLPTLFHDVIRPDFRGMG